MEDFDIRPAEDKDLPDILQLYQLSLGDTFGMRTETYWRWKHEQNPFGESPVLLAWKAGQLIGLRTFMRWRFQYRGKLFQAFRAVDTATHPEFQGRGIFSKLTMALVNKIQSGEPSIIFNTPNAQSKPGYLKMGWKVLGNTPLYIKVNPFYFFLHLLKQTVTEVEPVEWDEMLMEKILLAWKENQHEAIVTDYSMSYLIWRYRNIPNFRYQIKIERKDNSYILVIYRIKKTKWFQELRVNEVFYSGTYSKQLIRSTLRELNRYHKPDVVTVLADTTGVSKKSLPLDYFKASILGLSITYRKVNDQTLDELAQHADRWNFSAGTLELF